MINIKVRNLESIQKKINELPRGARGAATESAAKALIGDNRKGLQYYPPRKQHGLSNPYQWQTEKQRKAFFATNGFGAGIPTKRSFKLRFGWKVSKWGDGTKIKVINDEPSAVFVQGEYMQRGHKKDGWRTVPDIIAANGAAMMKAVNEALARYLKSKGLT